MGRPRGIIRRIADETDLDQATVRRALNVANLNEHDAAADIARAIEIVKATAESDRVLGHAASGRGDGGTGGDYANARAESERHRAEKLRLQNEKLRGSLIPREAVTQTGIRLISEVRTALLSLGTRVADKLAGKTDPKEIARLITQEVRDVLGALSDSDRFLTALLDDEALS